MTLRSPLHAMLWELWRVTRVEAAWRLSLGIVGGLVALVLFAAAAPNAKDAGAVIALGLIVVLQIAGWLVLPNLNGMRPGFPFALRYTRPVRTAVLVGVPMACLAAAQAAMYLVSALLLKAISGYPFPLLPVAAWIADPHPGPVRRELVDPQQGLHHPGKRDCRPGQPRSRGPISSPQRKSRAGTGPRIGGR